MILDSVKILYNTVKPQNSDSDMKKKIKKALKDQLDVYFKRYEFTYENQRLILQSALDPEFKSLSFFESKNFKKI